MRSTLRADTLNMHKVSNSNVNTGITPWQIPTGANWEEMLRAGTAPSQEDSTKLRAKARPSPLSRETYRFLIAGSPRVRNPVKPKHLPKTPSRPTTQKANRKVPNNPSAELRAGTAENDPANKVRIGDLEDDSVDEFGVEEELTRPPCRQAENTFDLEDRVFTVMHT